MACAKVVGDAVIEDVEIRVNGGEWVPMTPILGVTALWQAAGPERTPPSRRADGSDRDRVGAWPEKGILDTQLGSNRSGRK